MNLDMITERNKNADRWEKLPDNEKKLAGIILQILGSARRMTCSYDYEERPWQVILATSEESHFPFLFSCLDRYNQKCYGTAKVLGVILEQKYYDGFGAEVNSKFYDSEIFMTTAKSEAEKLNCSIHRMFGFSIEMVKAHFEIAEKYEPRAMFTIMNRNENTSILKPDYLQQIDFLMREDNEFNAHSYGKE